jgi:NADPH-dependent curcumin reductase CurA
MAKKVSEIMVEQAALPAAGMRRRWLLKHRPVGPAKLDDFMLVEDLIPEPPPGSYLARTIWLSMDPKQRLLMNASPRNAEQLPLYGVMYGNAVGEVIRSHHPKFAEGDIVMDQLGWQTHAVMDGTGHYINNPYGTRIVKPEHGPISTAVGVLGNGGLTAYYSVLRELKPKAGETILVSTAAGNVGSIAGQIAKMEGCRVIGLSSTAEKCRIAVDEFGCDVCLNYREEEDLEGAIRAAAPEGLDMFYDNVGGRIAQTASRLLNKGARITRVGFTEDYNTVIDGKPWTWPSEFAWKQFIIHEYCDEFDAGIEQLAAWIGEGKLNYREDVMEGFENAPAAMFDMLAGGNIGKRIVRAGANPDGIA